MIVYPWTSKAFTWAFNLAIWTVHILEKSIILMCLSSLRDSCICNKTQWQMFLLVSGRHVGVHPDGQQHGVSIQSSLNLGKKFLRISCLRKIAVTWILVRIFAYLPSFFSQIRGFIYWTALIFVLIYFEWCDTENQLGEVSIFPLFYSNSNILFHHMILSITDHYFKFHTKGKLPSNLTDSISKTAEKIVKSRANLILD